MSHIVSCVICLESPDNLTSEWKIIEVVPKSATFEQFFQGTTMNNLFATRQLKLKEVRIGGTKYDCDFASSDLKVVDATGVFGRYIKFVVVNVNIA